MNEIENAISQMPWFVILYGIGVAFLGFYVVRDVLNCRW